MIIYQNNELILSGSFVTMGPEETKLFLPYRNDIFCMTISFLSAHEEPQSKIRWEILDNGTIKVELTNFDNKNGHYSPEPIKVGEIMNRSLYLTFYINALEGTNMHLVHYSFYLERETPKK